MPESSPLFTPRQWQQLLLWQEQLDQAPGWSGELPVVVHERCWLRLRAIPVSALARELPPDTSAEAPELVGFRRAVAKGEDPWLAQLRCWEEFGQEACQQAQRTYWQRQAEGNQGWTLSRYLDLLSRYRRQLDPGGSRSLPMLLIARASSHEPHQLLWLRPLRQSMRHTCA